jgi:hypothetical protein
VSAVGRYLEEQGIPTVQISLIREHTAALKAPRALWVPFMLGRPFGVPNDAAFQTRVLKSALDLLARVDGPVLEDFPEDAPPDRLGLEDHQLVCPVSFPGPVRDGSIAQRLSDEVAQLTAWHELSVLARGRTTLGVTGASPQELVAFIVSWLGEYPQRVLQDPAMAPAVALKFATDELKSFYYEAKAMQPGGHTSDSILRWFWLETCAGEAFLALRKRLGQETDPSFKGLATLSMVPRVVLGWKPD